MQTILEYLEQAQHFEQLAADTPEGDFKKALLAQAESYRKLAERRASEIGVPLPQSERPQSN